MQLPTNKPVNIEYAPIELKWLTSGAETWTLTNSQIHRIRHKLVVKYFYVNVGITSGSPTFKAMSFRQSTEQHCDDLTGSYNERK